MTWRGYLLMLAVVTLPAVLLIAAIVQAIRHAFPAGY